MVLKDETRRKKMKSEKISNKSNKWLLAHIHTPSSFSFPYIGMSAYMCPFLCYPGKENSKRII